MNVQMQSSGSDLASSTQTTHCKYSKPLLRSSSMEEAGDVCATATVPDPTADELLAAWAKPPYMPNKASYFNPSPPTSQPSSESELSWPLLVPGVDDWNKNPMQNRALARRGMQLPAGYRPHPRTPQMGKSNSPTSSLCKDMNNVSLPPSCSYYYH